MRYLVTKPNGKQLIECILKGPYQMQLMEDLDKEEINIFLLCLPDEVYQTVDAAKSANEVWEKVRRKIEGLEVGKQDK
ncbi:hypothetical protein Tco_0799586 [Tanacetum coccineum]|uniref:Uncharacterized protein n=1 Tax=Tanacetum coccineum TaxID=301880 RepID=A0ABQ4ZV51_9ASTR